MKVFALRHREKNATLCLVALTAYILLGLVDSFTAQAGLFNQRRQPSSCLYDSDDGNDEETSCKEKLVSYLSTYNSEPNRLPCGIEGTDSDQKIALELVKECLSSPDNRLFKTNGKIKSKDILGEWEMLYTTSRTFSINKSLSGLGRSESESAKFTSLRQTFSGSQFLGFIEFVEKLGSDENGLDVVISGEWMLEPGVDSFTNLPVTAIRADLESVLYGPSKNKADDWSSLGPVKLLDVIYMDKDLYIARSKVKEDTVFVYQRVQ